MNDEWETPDDLYQSLHNEFDFKVDLCANRNNTKCTIYSTDVIGSFNNGSFLNFDNFWMNPPYSRGKIAPIMEIASFLAHLGKTVVCLVRFDPSAQWFQKHVDDVAAEVRMLNRRVKFKGAPSAYNFPCCVVVYQGRRVETRYRIWGWEDNGNYYGLSKTHLDKMLLLSGLKKEELPDCLECDTNINVVVIDPNDYEFACTKCKTAWMQPV